MSTLDDASSTTPSYAERHLRDVARHCPSWVTFSPSRARTISRVSQVPYWVAQWGNFARL
ncbi:hypothetical protein ACFRNT_33345 [Streptomyces sp. NPDC056697]|uniref:hypothetical protein n=1 Tax=Streptomyces sp. NPDC056697 TaxID=3345915 RepID=UPI00368F663C